MTKTVKRFHLGNDTSKWGLAGESQPLGLHCKEMEWDRFVPCFCLPNGSCTIYFFLTLFYYIHLLHSVNNPASRWRCTGLMPYLEEELKQSLLLGYNATSIVFHSLAWQLFTSYCKVGLCIIIIIALCLLIGSVAARAVMWFDYRLGHPHAACVFSTSPIMANNSLTRAASCDCVDTQFVLSMSCAKCAPIVANSQSFNQLLTINPHQLSIFSRLRWFPSLQTINRSATWLGTALRLAPVHFPLSSSAVHTHLGQMNKSMRTCQADYAKLWWVLLRSFEFGHIKSLQIYSRVKKVLLRPASSSRAFSWRDVKATRYE